MSEGKLDKLLAEVKRRLLNEQSLSEDVIGFIKIPLNLGGVSGNIEISSLNIQPKNNV